jgi:hypothetical protein
MAAQQSSALDWFERAKAQASERRGVEKHVGKEQGGETREGKSPDMRERIERLIEQTDRRARETDKGRSAERGGESGPEQGREHGRDGGGRDR